MKWLTLAFPLLLITAICSAQEEVKTTKVNESLALKEAQILVDKETKAMKKVAPDNKGKGFNKKMTKGLAARLVKNKASQKKELEVIAAKLTQDDKSKLVDYAKEKSSASKTDKNTIVVMANDPGSVKGWCDSYQGRVDFEKYCTGVVEWCWDVCVLPDQSKKHYESPYACGACFVFPF